MCFLPYPPGRSEYRSPSQSGRRNPCRWTRRSQALLDADARGRREALRGADRGRGAGRRVRLRGPAGRARGGRRRSSTRSSPARPPTCRPGSTRPRGRPPPRPRLLPRLRLGRAQHRGLRHDGARAGQLHRLQGDRGQLPEGARAPVPGAVRGRLGGDEWVFENAEALGLDPARIGVVGDSAGGNLAAAVALRARDEGAPSSPCRRSSTPPSSTTGTPPSARENAEGYLLQRESMHWFWDHYVPDESLSDDLARLAAARADHSGLPPAFIATAEFDPLRDDGRATTQACTTRACRSPTSSTTG